MQDDTAPGPRPPHPPNGGCRTTGSLPTLSEVRAEIARELKMRESAFPRFIERGQLTQREADIRIARLRAALDYLPEPQPEPDLFSRGAKP